MGSDRERAPGPWWKRGVVYQIYPRSFQDGNGDGVGDLRGVLARLDHLSWLGVDAVWISPIYPSPMADFGYDVADYCGIDPLFGTLDDFDALVGALHARGIKLILDLVPNHSSAAHPWFAEARASRASPKRDWYIWRDPAPDGGPPNNWESQAGGPAWTLDPATGQYYYHAFLAGQPDLNWRHPEVRTAMYDAMRFWLDRGVDGFRVDVIWHLIKDAEFRDDPLNPGYRPEVDPPFRRVVQVHSVDQPEVHGIVREMRRLLDGYDGDRLLIGEIYLPLERLMAYYGHELTGAHLPFNFQLIGAPWHAATLAAMIEAYERALPAGGWGNWVLGNHDQPRIASRVGPAQARVAATLLLTLRGTPTLYYGDEIGMVNVPVPPDRERDPFGLRMPGTGQGRDPERAPMVWEGGAPHAGFCPARAEPWLPQPTPDAVPPVDAARADPASILHLTRRLLELRRATPALHAGTFRALAAERDVLLYERSAPPGGGGPARVAVALNLGPEPREVDLPAGFEAGRVLLSTRLDREGEAVAVGGPLRLRADEGLLVAAASAGAAP